LVGDASYRRAGGNFGYPDGWLSIIVSFDLIILSILSLLSDGRGKTARKHDRASRECINTISELISLQDGHQEAGSL